MIKSFSGISLGHDLAPRGVWKTDSVTTKTTKQQTNLVASAIRTTAISEAANAVTQLPTPVKTTTTLQEQQSSWPVITHPALNNTSETVTTAVVDIPTWDDLVDIRDTLNTAIDKEMARTTDDRLFLALRRVKADVNADIQNRLLQTEKTIVRSPAEVVPAIVLAATWYDNAARETDITRRNTVSHPGFIPVRPLRVPTR